MRVEGEESDAFYHYVVNTRLAADKEPPLVFVAERGTATCSTVPISLDAREKISQLASLLAMRYSILCIALAVLVGCDEGSSSQELPGVSADMQQDEEAQAQMQQAFTPSKGLPRAFGQFAQSNIKKQHVRGFYLALKRELGTLAEPDSPPTPDEIQTYKKFLSQHKDEPYHFLLEQHIAFWTPCSL